MGYLPGVGTVLQMWENVPTSASHEYHPNPSTAFKRKKPNGPKRDGK